MTEAHPPNILIIQLHSSYNAGDYALASAAVDILEEYFPGSRITLSMNLPESHPGEANIIGSFVGAVQKSDPSGKVHWALAALLRLIPASFLTALLYRSIGRRRPALVHGMERELLQAYLDADLIVSAPGNHLYSSGKVGSALLVSIYAMAYVLLIGKPLYLLPQSIGPFRRRWEQRLVNAVLRRSRLVLVREEATLELLRRSGLREANVRFSPDLAFAFRGAPQAEAKRWLQEHGVETGSRPVLGVTTIDWGVQTGAQEVQHRYEQAVGAAVEGFVCKLNGQAVFFPQVHGSAPGAQDIAAAERIAARLAEAGAKDVVVIEQPPAAEMLQGAYAQMDLFVGTRMHSNLFALVGGVPVLAVAYRHKTRGMMRALGLERWVVDIETVSSETLAETLLQLWEQRERVREQVAERVPPLREHARQAGKWIAEDYQRYRQERGDRA